MKPMKSVYDAFKAAANAMDFVVGIAFLIGLFLGTALCICQGIGAVSIGWFWATFPFWGPWAGLFALSTLVGAVSSAIDQEGAMK